MRQVGEKSGVWEVGRGQVGGEGVRSRKWQVPGTRLGLASEGSGQVSGHVKSRGIGLPAGLVATSHSVLRAGGGASWACHPHGPRLFVLSMVTC